VGHTTNTTENCTAHEMVRIRAETINDIMVIPNIQLRNSAVGAFERLSSIPQDVVVEIVIVAPLAQVFAKEKIASLLGIGDGCPLVQRPVNPYSIIVDLIATSNLRL
jgi:hypothetical protein